MARDHVAIRITEQAKAEVTRIADAHFEGNFSVAMRRLLSLGLAAWRDGKR